MATANRKCLVRLVGFCRALFSSYCILNFSQNSAGVPQTFSNLTDILAVISFLPLNNSLKYPFDIPNFWAKSFWLSPLSCIISFNSSLGCVGVVFRWSNFFVSLSYRLIIYFISIFVLCVGVG